MSDLLVSIRRAKADDSAGLSRVFEAAWREAYLGRHSWHCVGKADHQAEFRVVADGDCSRATPRCPRCGAGHRRLRLVWPLPRSAASGAGGNRRTLSRARISRGRAMGGGFSKRFAMTCATARCRIRRLGVVRERPRAAFLREPWRPRYRGDRRADRRGDPRQDRVICLAKSADPACCPTSSRLVKLLEFPLPSEWTPLCALTRLQSETTRRTT